MRRKAKDPEHYFAASPRSKPKLGLLRTNLRGKPFEFLTSSGVFSKSRIDLGTRLLAECMVLPQTGCVLDIGCGYGALGICAAAINPRLRVVLVDVNRRAVWLARQNIERNDVLNAEVRKGFLYEPVEDLVFHCVLCNPPVSAGMDIVRQIVCEAPKQMAHKGSFEMVVRSKVGGRRLLGFFEEAFGNVEVLARESGYRVLMSSKCWNDCF